MIYSIRLLIIIQFFLITILCNGMNEKQNIINKLIPQDAYPQIEFITDNKIILNINNLFRHHACYIVDLQNNKLQKIEIGKPFVQDKDKLSHYLIKVSMHPNKKVFSLYQCGGIATYDTETGVLQRSTGLGFRALEACATMSATSNTVLFWNYDNSFVTEWNYTTNKTHIINMTPQYPVNMIECHPNKNEVFVQTNDYQNVYNENDYSIIHDKSAENIQNFPFFTYSSDGSFAAYSKKISLDNYFIEIVDAYFFKKSFSSIIYEKGNVKALAFHPNNAFLAISSDRNKNLKYFNIKQQKFIIETPTPHTDTNYSYASIKFSPNGKQVIVIFRQSYIFVDVPFEVIYQPKTKQILPFILFLLKNYKLDEHNPLPQDIIYLLANATLETFKY